MWRRLGLSVDWSTMYRTIGADSRAISQRAFLRDLARGDAYLAEAPTLWDVTFRTAVAQAEVEDREVTGAYYRIAFRAPDGGVVPVATTRPELLPACVALVAHPDDERYAGLFGTTVRTPLFGVEVPVLAHHLADPGKGTGIAMVCTFGDASDVTWWRDLGLPTRPVTGPDGRFVACPPAAITSRPGRGAYRQLAGETAVAARQRITRLLRSAGDLLGGPEPVRHAVNFYEKGSQPLEIITSQQWYLRNGGRDPELAQALLAGGREIDWHPAHMRVRYENWVNGLNGDWLVSRQRFFGVPIPVWYPLDAEGQPRNQEPIIPPGRHPAGRSHGRHAARVPLPPSAASPAASPATRTCSTPGPRPRSPRRSPPAGPSTATCRPGCCRWICGRRRTRSSAPGCSTRCCARTPGTAPCRGGTWRSPAGCSTRTARRCPSRRGTWSPRWTRCASTAATRSATGRPAAASASTWPSTRPS